MVNGTTPSNPTINCRSYLVTIPKQMFFGGRVCFNYLYTMTSNEDITKITTNIKASFKVCTASTSTEKTSEIKNTEEKSEISSLSVGGGNYDFTSLDAFKKNYPAWKTSVTNTPEPCDIVDINNLVPIWTFCTNQTRAKQIETEFTKLINESVNGLIPKTTAVSECCFVASTKSEGDMIAKRKCPAGYTLVDVDLNKGAGGNFIYLCYKKSTTDAPITDMFIDHYTKAQTANTKKITHNGTLANYTMLSTDLNAGAGGKYIYLWITRDKVKAPIKEIMAFANSKESAALTEATSNNWEVIRWFNSSGGADLNKGAGGNYIYISVKR